MNDCIFCRIAQKESDALILCEDEDLMAFLDIRPIRRGHCQIIPKRHVETFEVLPPDLAARIIVLGQDLARRIKMVYKVDRVAFLFTGGDVAHAHAHVVPMHEKGDIGSPRYMKDGRPSSSHLQVDKDTLVEVRKELGF